MLPTGQQFEITSGTARAVVTEVGAGLRAFTEDGRPYVETFAEDRRPPRGAGTVLVPWPNRTRAGRWTWEGQPQQLVLSEPPAGNAIHGLLRHVLYRTAERSADAITLQAGSPSPPPCATSAPPRCRSAWGRTRTCAPATRRPTSPSSPSARRPPCRWT